jgi:hypothetical protein
VSGLGQRSDCIGRPKSPSSSRKTSTASFAFFAMRSASLMGSRSATSTGAIHEFPMRLQSAETSNRYLYFPVIRSTQGSRHGDCGSKQSQAVIVGRGSLEAATPRRDTRRRTKGCAGPAAWAHSVPPRDAKHGSAPCHRAWSFLEIHRRIRWSRWSREYLRIGATASAGKYRCRARASVVIGPADAVDRRW